MRWTKYSPPESCSVAVFHFRVFIKLAIRIIYFVKFETICADNYDVTFVWYFNDQEFGMSESLRTIDCAINPATRCAQGPPSLPTMATQSPRRNGAASLPHGSCIVRNSKSLKSRHRFHASSSLWTTNSRRLGWKEAYYCIKRRVTLPRVMDRSPSTFLELNTPAWIRLLSKPSALSHFPCRFGTAHHLVNIRCEFVINDIVFVFELAVEY